MKGIRPTLAAAIAVACGLLGEPPPTSATSPVLYRQPAYESPVRAEPDDLMLLAGDGFAATDTVVYQALANTTLPLNAPASVPLTSSSTTGVATIVSSADIPRSLTIRLPATMKTDQSYALWVRNSDSEWSEGVKINDARPLWLSPAYVYSSSSVASLPRQLKVIGRNLQPAPGEVTQLRLAGPVTLMLTAANDADPATAIEHYAAVANLPKSLPAGDYTVSVRRDGASWVALEGQTLRVKPDPAPETDFSVTSYGGCVADDGADDTACIVAAINAAAATGGTVVFGTGKWNLTTMSAAGVTADGILVPPGVRLAGAGAELTTLVRSATWTRATLTLQGHNTVRGFRFEDARVYQRADQAGAMLQLGKAYQRVDASDSNDPTGVDDIVITHNIFDKPFIAIADAGLPIHRLFVTYNAFGAYLCALFPGGNRYNTTYPFRLDDSVVAYNTFKPGSYLDVPSAQGTIASQIGAARRLDFSNNIADGAATDYLYSPSTDAKGWRAAFFWHMNGNHEMLLVSQNEATCTGDKDGDGEAIVLDNNANTFGFSRAQTVLEATSTTVTVGEPLQSTQNGVGIDLAHYYIGHWIQLAQGRGTGQARRIESYAIDAASGHVTFTVAPAWDVVPEPNSTRLALGREFWQTYIVDNRVDHRQPLCFKSNRTKQSGGIIGITAQTADSAVEGNRQYDANGIVIQQAYSAADKTCADCVSWTSLVYFLEVRGNTIDGEYAWNSDCSWAGVIGSMAAARTPGSPPPTASCGVSIARNSIRQSDALRGGAITVAPTWWQGPAPYDWKIADNLLIHHNSIRDMSGPAPARVCDNPQSSRAGINLYQATTAWRSVLYANSCTNVTVPLKDTANGTVRVCPSSVPSSCECP